MDVYVHAYWRHGDSNDKITSVWCDWFTWVGVRLEPSAAPDETTPQIAEWSSTGQYDKLMTGRHRTDAKSTSRALWTFHRTLEEHKQPRAKESAERALTVLKDAVYAEIEAQERGSGGQIGAPVSVAPPRDMVAPRQIWFLEAAKEHL